MDIDFRDERPGAEDLVGLYEAVGWAVYARDPGRLEAAIANSAYVVTARAAGDLVGLARCISDDISIAYLQDILVHPDHQRAGIGRSLMERCLERFAGVRQVVLLTDDRPDQLGFYGSLGFANTRELTKTPLNAFVRIAGVDLA